MNENMVRNKHDPPGIVKFSFWRMTAENHKAVYVCINKGEAYAPKEIADRSICIDGDIGEALKKNERPLFAVVQAHGSLPSYVMMCKTIVKRIVFPF